MGICLDREVKLLGEGILWCLVTGSKQFYMFIVHCKSFINVQIVHFDEKPS